MSDRRSAKRSRPDTGALRTALLVRRASQGQPVPLDTNASHYRNLVVTGTTGGSVEDYRIALSLVAGKQVDLMQIVSNVFGLDDLQAAYDAAQSGST